MSILQQDIMAQAQGNTKTKAKANTLAKVSIVAALTRWGGGGVTNPYFTAFSILLDSVLHSLILATHIRLYR